jgi:hypothetical protein
MFLFSADCNKAKSSSATQETLSISIMAHMPLTKWNLIKSELIEMWQIVQAVGQSSQLAAKRLG